MRTALIRGFAATLALIVAVAPAARAREGGPASSAKAQPAAIPVPLDGPAQTSALCNAAIAAAEARYGTPPGLLSAIARVESGRPIPPTNVTGPWPWAIDADGGAYFFDSKSEAVAWARTAIARGVKYIDVGCMQIDLPQHPQAFRSLEDAFDPALNTDYGARYLKSLRDGETGGDWTIAVGLYHSHTPDLAMEYRQRVADMGAGLLHGLAGDPSLFGRAMRQGTLHLALAGGGMLIINVNRQPSARGHRHMTACQAAAILGPYLSSPARRGACGR
jgi:hypothetical protein